MTLILFAVALPLLVALLAAVCFWSSGRIERAYAVGTGTSAIAAAIAVEGLLLNVGNGSSPETFYTVANVSDVTLPLAAKTVDVTNGENHLQDLLGYGGSHTSECGITSQGDA